MGRLNLLFAAAVFGLLAGAVGLALCLPFGNPVEVKLVSVEKNPQDANRKVVTVEFRNRGSNWVYFTAGLKVQARVGDGWLAAEKFPELDDTTLLRNTRRQNVRFLLPRQAEACRFLLNYRVGGSPYCRAYFFLGRHGVSARFPTLSRVILKLFPHAARLHHAAPELILPPDQPGLAMHAALKTTNPPPPCLTVL